MDFRTQSMNQMRRVQAQHKNELTRLNEEAKKLHSEKTLEEERSREAVDKRTSVQEALKKAEVKSVQQGNDMERWRDLRAGTQDELTVDKQSLKELQKGRVANLNGTSTLIRTDTTRVKEMHLFYNATECFERLPTFEAQISSKVKERDEWTKQVEVSRNKFAQLSLKREIQRGNENNFPSDDLKQFIMKETKKYRIISAKKVGEIRFEMTRLNTEDTTGASGVGSPGFPTD